MPNFPPPPKPFNPPANETLRQKQSRFTRMQADLILWAYNHGYELTDGDAYRDPRVHGALGETMPNAYGAKSSCHKLRLARDYNLFKNGLWLQATESFEPLGVYWESLASDAVWGGRFNDGNHFSLIHEGHK